MKLLAFSIVDAALSAYRTPFFCPTKGQASRYFGDLVTDGQTEIAKHPTDYSLWEVGSFDDATGRLESGSTPVLVCRGSDFVVLVGGSERAPGQDAVQVMRRQVGPRKG